MKKISIIIFLIALVGLFSCKKDETKAVISSNPVPPVLKLSVDSLVLSKTHADSTMITFHWSTANFGIALVVTYTVQVDKQGDNFKNALSIGTVSVADSFAIVAKDLNNMLLGMEFNSDLNPSAPMALEFRVQASVSAFTNPVNSAVVSKVVTPYFVKIVYPFLFVPGAYNGWNAGDSLTVIYSVKANGIYDGYIYFDSIGTGTNAGYKYTKDPQWATNWGDNGGTGTLVPGGGNIKPTTGPGYYHLTANTSALTHTFLLTTWSIYGSSTGNTDMAMTYDPVTRTLSVTQSLSAGTFVFRANNANTLFYSDPAGTGKLTQGDPSSLAGITVTAAGNYTVTLNFTGAVFRYSLKQN
jgi:hypothetical protein